MALSRTAHRTPAGLPPAIDATADPVELLTYAADAGLESGRPNAVAFPRSADDVARLVAWASERGVPLIPRGAGTGTSGGAIAGEGGMILAFARMDRIVELDVTGRRATVQPGTVNAVLDAAAGEHGLFFPPDPASGRICTLGGNIAENAGGPRCFKYGVTANYVSGLRAVLADGRVVRFGGRALDYPDYDWVGVLTGSEGTLAVVVEADLRLLRRPPASGLLMAAFASLEAAGDAVSEVIARGLAPATIEMMDQVIVAVVEQYAHLGLPPDAAAVLIVEVDGYEAALAPQLDEIAAVLRRQGATYLELARDAAQRERIWNARKGSAGALARLAPAYYPSDCTVPRSRIADTLHEINRICAADGLRVCYLLHAGDGNLHPHILIDDPADPELMRRVLAAEAQALEYCVAQGGSLTGEHGVGSERRHFMPIMHTADELAAMHDVKLAFDPTGLLNPGKIFPDAAAPQRTAVAAPDRAPAHQPLQGSGADVQGALPARPGDASGPPGVPHRGLPENRLGQPGDVPETPPGPRAAASAGSATPVELVPTSAEDAAEAIRALLAGPDPLILRIRGGGSKSAFLPPTGAVLSTRGLAGIRRYAPADQYVTAGAGTRLADLQAELARDGVWVPLVSPWPEATLGGIISASFNAPLRMRYGYGGVRDVMLAARVALPDGRLIRAGRPLVKNVAGYDMPRLFVGARGTLGLLCDVTLRLAPRPRAVASLVLPVEDAAAAARDARVLLPICLAASALLLCPASELPGLATPFALVYTVEGMAEEVQAELDEATAALAASGVTGAGRLDGLSGSELWAGFVRRITASGLSVRAGLAPGDLDRLLALPGPAPFLADLANGHLYAALGGDEQPGRPVPEEGSRAIDRLGAIREEGSRAIDRLGAIREEGSHAIDRLGAIRRAALEAGGYAVLLSAPPDLVPALDPWGYPGAAPDVASRLKSAWDPAGAFNPGALPAPR